MKVNLLPFRQFVLAIYDQDTDKYVRQSIINDKGDDDRLIRDVESRIDRYREFPTEASGRIVARIIGTGESGRSRLVAQEAVQLLKEIASAEGLKTLQSLADDAKNVLRQGYPQEFKTSSKQGDLDGVTINTFEFITLIADGGVNNILTLQHATPEAIVKNTDELAEWIGSRCKGSEPRRRTDLQLRLMQNPKFLGAAIEGFLGLKDASELVDFAYALRNLGYYTLQKEWRERDNLVTEMMIDAMKRAALIAEAKLSEEEGYLPGNTDSEFIEEFMKYAMIFIKDPPLREISFDKKIAFGESFRDHLILIAQALPDKVLTETRIASSLNQITSDLDLPKDSGMYYCVKAVFDLFIRDADLLFSSSQLRSHRRD